MKSVKAVAIALVLSAGMSILCCGCNTQTGTTRRSRERDKEKQAVELPEDEILIVSRSNNEAWDHQRGITIVTSDGNVYNSSVYFGYGATQGLSDLSYEDELTLLRKYTDPIGRFEKNDLLAIYKHMLKINPDSKFKYSDEVWYDAGTTTVQVLTAEGEYVKISESGCKNGELLDRYAMKTAEEIRTCFRSLDLGKLPVCYLTCDTVIDTIPCTKDLKGSYRRIITGIDELREIERLAGISFTGMEGFEYFGDADYDSFSSVCIAVEITGYDEYLNLSEVSPEAFIVSDSYVGFGFVEDPEIAISDDIVDQNYYCHVAVIPNYDLSIYKPFED